MLLNEMYVPRYESVPFHLEAEFERRVLDTYFLLARKEPDLPVTDLQVEEQNLQIFYRLASLDQYGSESEYLEMEKEDGPGYIQFQDFSDYRYAEFIYDIAASLDKYKLSVYLDMSGEYRNLAGREVW